MIATLHSPISHPKLAFTEDQNRALRKLDRFIANPHPTEPFGIFGYAGTGKSTLTFQFVRQLLSLRYRVAMTGSTNKAVEQLQEIALEQGITGITFMTIHSLLGLALVREGNQKILKRKETDFLDSFDVVFVDEASMIDKQLYAHIQRVAAGAYYTLTSTHPPYIILMGDPGQLNPVNETRSLAFNICDKVVLTQVVRQGQGSPLLEFITAIRRHIPSQKKRVPLRPFKPYAHHSQDKRNGAVLVNEQTLINYAYQKIAKHFTNNPNSFRILCWTNNQVDWYNNEIRRRLYGDDAPQFMPGERLITREPIYAPDHKITLFPTSSEFVVKEIYPDFYSGHSVWRLVVQAKTGPAKQIYVLHESEQQRFNHQTDQLLSAAKRNPYLWRRYYQHLETFANVRPCFALTVHNAQGSTFNEVGIDGDDIYARMGDRTSENVLEMNRLFYVAASRARHRALIVWSNPIRRQRRNLQYKFRN
ncbi:MAG: AAA family ATPase [Leptolyngbyaceae cyanobacterium bins.302]|nr:AAA family ATPase [Leptolyngbyaceae cyanobacterium bins.302]